MKEAKETNCKLVTTYCRLTNEIEGMCGAGNILGTTTLLANNCLHATVFPTHVACIVARLSAAISNINAVGL